MPKATTEQNLSDTWVQVANLGQTFMFEVIQGVVLLRWAAADPGAGVITGHVFTKEDGRYQDVSPTQIAWMRRQGNQPASIVISKE